MVKFRHKSPKENNLKRGHNNEVTAQIEQTTNTVYVHMSAPTHKDTIKTLCARTLLQCAQSRWCAHTHKEVPASAHQSSPPDTATKRARVTNSKAVGAIHLQYIYTCAS